jgi:hypothetical protein
LAWNLFHDRAIEEGMGPIPFFFNTATRSNKVLTALNGPTVLTVNPNDSRSKPFLADPAHFWKIPFVRWRARLWDIEHMHSHQGLWQVLEHYINKSVPVVLTFMAFPDILVPNDRPANYSVALCPALVGMGYEYRKRTTNSYWAVEADAVDWYWRYLERRLGSEWRGLDRLSPAWIGTCGDTPRGPVKCAECRKCASYPSATWSKYKQIFHELRT